MARNKKNTSKINPVIMKYPLYYLIDDIPIALIIEKGMVVGRAMNGRLFPIGKAIVEGYQITNDEYLKLLNHFD